jgi:hypothetical protein
MNIGIIGAGPMGTTLARHFTRLGHEVASASPRGADSLPEVVRERDLVILAIPTNVVATLPRTLFATVPTSVIVIDLGNYHPELRDGRIAAIEAGLLDSKWVAERIGHPVIKAFNNIFAQSLLERAVAKGDARRIALPASGDSVAARSVVLRLIDDIGFDPVDAGDLDAGFRHATGTPTYCKHLDEVALRRALAAAEPGRVAEYRATEEERIRIGLRRDPLGAVSV